MEHVWEGRGGGGLHIDLDSTLERNSELTPVARFQD